MGRVFDKTMCHRWSVEIPRDNEIITATICNYNFWYEGDSGGLKKFSTKEDAPDQSLWLPITINYPTSMMNDEWWSIAIPFIHLVRILNWNLHISRLQIVYFGVRPSSCVELRQPQSYSYPHYSDTENDAAADRDDRDGSNLIN